VAALVGALIALQHRSSASPRVTMADAPTAAAATWAAGMRRAPDFRQVDQGGGPGSRASFRGRPVIVTFIDPLCRNFCPLEAQQLNELVRRLPAAQRPAIVAVSVNVYGNARANLLQDVAKWRLVPEWRWAVGRTRQLATVWRRYRIGVLVTTKRVAGVTVHEISHTEAAYVIDRRGYERALFLWPFGAKDVRAALAKLSSSSA
jgi:cytochrome oxidase Cu insertion factor (SCO1/SenC/PrrC family)